MRSLVAVAISLMCAGGVSAQTVAEKCEAGKNEAAGKLAACLAKAEKKFVLDGDAVAYATAAGKCNTKYTTKWSKLEQKAVDALEAQLPGTTGVGSLPLVESDGQVSTRES